MYKLKLNDLEKFFAAISENRALYAPVEKGDLAEFARIKDGTEVSLSRLNTAVSPKGLFFPQSENLVSFKMENKSISIIPDRAEDEKAVIFGVRACDMRGIEVLDKVFLAEPVDTYYKNRRDNTVIITLACQKPAETCFCNVFGIDAANPGGDISAWMDEENLFLNPETSKGRELLEEVGALLSEAKDTDADEIKEGIKEIIKKLPLSDLPIDAFKNAKTEDVFDLPDWKELSESCIGCGTCTFVCPTCQCYDIKDYDTGHGIKRFRCWDSCMYSDFTKMAHGNPRLTQVERFRQRFMHKLIYFPENNDGVFSCTGCGRCVAKCPISMNIAKVMRKIGKTLEGKEKK